MNKKFLTITFLSLLLILVVSVAYAGGPWEVKVEGNGYLFGPYGYGDVSKADVGWNMKYNTDTGQVNGQLNIVETLTDGSIRHFKLAGYQVWDVEDPTVRPILFRCNEVRVEGYDDQGRRIAAHFRPPTHLTLPNTIWYYVMDSDGYITNTAAQLTLDSDMSLWCAGP